jgi:hypothetical protein
MLEPNPKQRYKFQPISITLPTRKWNTNLDVFKPIWKTCVEIDYGTATFVHAVDIRLRIGTTTTINTLLLLAGCWNEETQYDNFTKKEKREAIQIIKKLQGQLYIPGLEYMHKMSYEDIVKEFTRLLESGTYS